MSTKIERFYAFMLKERTRNFTAFIFYILFISMVVKIRLPLILTIIQYIIAILIIFFCFPIYQNEYFVKIYEENRGELGKNIIKEANKIAKEILVFIPILLISSYVTSAILVGQPANQIRINESFYEAPILNSIEGIIIAPITEEFICRFLPYKFIKNKILYIVISSLVFAALHVVNNPNPFYYIWFYMIRPLYYGYRYHKTKDILVPISMHSFNNLISTLLFVLSTQS